MDLTYEFRREDFEDDGEALAAFDEFTSFLMKMRRKYNKIKDYYRHAQVQLVPDEDDTIWLQTSYDSFIDFQDLVLLSFGKPGTERESLEIAAHISPGDPPTALSSEEQQTVRDFFAAYGDLAHDDIDEEELEDSGWLG